DTAAIDTAAIDATTIDPTTAVHPASVDAPASVHGSTPVSAPASDCGDQRIRAKPMRKHQMRLHDRGDGLGWLRNEKRCGHCNCQRSKSRKDSHLQLLAPDGGTCALAFLPGSRPLLLDAMSSIGSLISIK